MGKGKGYSERELRNIAAEILIERGFNIVPSQLQRLGVPTPRNAYPVPSEVATYAFAHEGRNYQVWVEGSARAIWLAAEGRAPAKSEPSNLTLTSISNKSRGKVYEALGMRRVPLGGDRIIYLAGSELVVEVPLKELRERFLRGGPNKKFRIRERSSAKPGKPGEYGAEDNFWSFEDEIGNEGGDVGSIFDPRLSENIFLVTQGGITLEPMQVPGYVYEVPLRMRRVPTNETNETMVPINLGDARSYLTDGEIAELASLGKVEHNLSTLLKTGRVVLGESKEK